MREVSGYKQYKLLVSRMCKTALRIPIAFIALIMMGFFVGVMQGSLFDKVGAE